MNVSWFSVSSRVVYSVSFRISFPWDLRIKVNALFCGPGQMWWWLSPGFLGCQVFLATAGSTYVQWHPWQGGLCSHVEGPDLFFMLPEVVVSMLNVFLKLHQREHERPKFVTYSHLRIRSKPFPWGDGSHNLGHNAHVNVLPTAMKRSREPGPLPRFFPPLLRVGGGLNK